MNRTTMNALFVFLIWQVSAASAFVVVAPPAAIRTRPLFSYLGNLESSATPGVGVGESTASPAAPSVAGALDAPPPQPGNAWETMTPIVVQGGSLKTWSFVSEVIERVQVLLKTEGRPLNANVDLWQGPDNTPQKMAIYIEDGSLRPFSAIVETPRGPNAVAIRNTGQLEFPLSACVEADFADGSGAGLQAVVDSLATMSVPETVQGGAIKTYSFDPSVASVQIMLVTDGRPMNARLELLQGPNNNKQVIELYIEDGMERPFYCIMETPGTGNVVRIQNTAPVEFPLGARVEPYLVEEFDDASAIIVSDGGPGW